MTELTTDPRFRARYAKNLRARLIRERDEAIAKLETAVSILRQCALAANDRDRALATYQKAIESLRALNPDALPDPRDLQVLARELETTSEDVTNSVCLQE